MKGRFRQLLQEMVNQKKIPRYVYRMRTVNDYLFDSLENNQIWFSQPSGFNDPFDCDINISMIGSSIQEIQNYFNDYLSKIATEEEKDIIQDMSSITTEEFEKVINRVSKRIVGKKGIACFLSNKENLLMWAHYADSHKGICLKFDVLEDLDFFSPSLPVKYEKEYPKYNYLKERNDLVKYMFFTKSKDWEYEGEIRVLKDESGNHSYQNSALKEIIIGCKCTPENTDKIKNVIARKYPDCKITYSKKKKNEFGLTFK